MFRLCKTFYFTTQKPRAASCACRWTKNLSTKTTKYIPECWERSVIRKSNPNFIRVIKNSSFDQHFLYIWTKPFKKFFGDNFLFPAHIVISSATLSCKTGNIWTLSVLVQYNTNSFSLRTFSPIRGSVQFITALKCFRAIPSSFWSFIVSSWSLVLLLPNIAS